MIELLLCSLVTVLPDYLYRRYVQGKRLGREITLYSVWFELRYGITTCILLTISLLTLILYFHPSASNAVSLFRTVPVLPEGSGRVEEVYVNVRDKVKAGQPIFRLDSSREEAALETARRRLSEIDAAVMSATSELAAADARIREADAALQQAEQELETKTELQRRNASTVSVREIERLQILVAGREAAVSTAQANRETTATQVSSVLPAQRASAEAQLAEAQVALDKTVIRAGIDGTLEQFTLRKGDVVNPLMRPAGVLIPNDAGRWGLIAGFNQLEAQVIKVGMITEAACISNPLKIIPMVVTDVQGLIASGQLRASDQLLDAQQASVPGTLTVYIEPLFEGGFDNVPPGSKCLVNAYTSNYERLQDKNIGTMTSLALHMIDTVGLVHAIILRIQALLLPFQQLVFSSEH